MLACTHFDEQDKISNRLSIDLYHAMLKQKDFARPTSHPVRGWTGKNKAFCSPGTQTGGCVIKVY